MTLGRRDNAIKELLRELINLGRYTKVEKQPALFWGQNQTSRSRIFHPHDQRVGSCFFIIDLWLLDLTTLISCKF